VLGLRRSVALLLLTSTRGLPWSICMVMPLAEPAASLLPTSPTKPLVWVLLTQNAQVPVVMCVLGESAIST
jgi:hypothetical protein